MAESKKSGNPVLNFLRGFVPPISETEQIALDAGTVGWEQSLFKGSPDWERIFSYKPVELTPEERSFLENETEELCEMIDNWEVRQNYDLPQDIWDFIKEKKFWGMLIDKEHGGLGFSATARSAVVTKIASRSLDAAVAIMVPNSLGPGELLEKYGTVDQKEKYLPRLSDGRETPCFGLTEPEAGSDAGGGMQSRGVVEKGEDGQPVINLNFDKRYITLGPKATLLGVAFKLEDPDNLLGKGTEPGITLALLPSDLENVENGNRHLPMNQTFPNGTLRGRNVKIDPETHLIGGTEQVGNGWRMLMECLSEGRANSLPSLATAGAQYATRTTSAYATVRTQFKMSVGAFPGIEEKLAEMAGLSYTIGATKAATLQMVDNGENPTVPSSLSKYHTTEMMRTAIDGAMDVHAGKGIQSGPNNYLNNIYDGVPVAITVEGANILTRNMLVFGQGSYRLHPHIRPLKDSIDNGKTLKALGQITSLGASLVGSVAKGVMHGLTRGALITTSRSVADSPMKDYYKDIERLSKRFNAIASPMTVALGGDLKKKEDVSARMGDALSHLYMATSVLKHFEDRGAREGEVNVASWAVENSLHEAYEAMHKVLRKDNFPQAKTGLQRALLQPVRPLISLAEKFDKAYEKPSFKLRHKVAQDILRPGPDRDSLTDSVFRPSNENDPLYKLEQAYDLKHRLDGELKDIRAFARQNGLSKAPLSEQLDAALNARQINVHQKQFIEGQIEQYEVLRKDVVDTDEFRPDDLVNPVKPEPVFAP